jgi:uncharacterized protein DUF4375
VTHLGLPPRTPRLWARRPCFSATLRPTRTRQDLPCTSAGEPRTPRCLSGSGILALVTDEYLVGNTIGYLADDLSDDARFADLTRAERTAVLSWVMDRLIRSDGIQSWIESLGQRSAEAVTALRDLGTNAHAMIVEEALRLFPTAAAGDPDGRLAAMSSWSAEDVSRWRELEGRYLALAHADDLADNYIAPYIRARPGDFPQTIDQL